MSKDTERNAAELLAAYAAELRSETPLLERYTDMMPRPDGLGGEAEREFDKGLRHNLQHPIDATEFELCVVLLELLKDRPTAWGALQDALYLCDQSGLALALEKRRERRRTDLDRVIAEAEAIAPEFDLTAIIEDVKADGEKPDLPAKREDAPEGWIVYRDYRDFEAAAKRFDAGIADDVAFIERVACQVAAEAVTRPTERTLLERIDANAQRAASGIGDVSADTTATALKVEAVSKGVAYLVADRKRKAKANKVRGAENYAKGNAEEAERAARDMKTALGRVCDRVKHGETNVLAVCRDVCARFERLTNKKNALGKYVDCLPLIGKNGKPIKPETLARNYRDQRKRPKAAKQTRRTK